MSSAESNKRKLPDGWVLCQSKSIPGRTYYFNKKTGKSSWSQPQADDKSDPKMGKKDKIRKAEKRKKEELHKKSVKRKSDGYEESTSKKRPKQASDKWENVARKESNTHKFNKKRGTPSKSGGNSSFKSSTTKTESPLKQSPVKNLANSRMSLLREQLANEVNEESESVSPSKKAKGNPITGPCDIQKSKIDNKSPSNDLKSSQSPTNESVQSSPSPSQFFAANKIISSMKAQLPDEYYNIDKQKDTFADIEKGICSQMPEYPSLKHPATPPQFSEATKLMSAIKSKLTYKGSPKESEKSFTSAKDRMEQLRANLSSDLSDADLNISRRTEVSESNSMVEAMEVEDVNEMKPNEKSAVQKDIIKGADLVVVVDTNIFIHELELIKNVLNSHIKGYSEQPTLLVPWRVINELDRLKDNNNGNGALCKRAKSAMDYLYKSLPENSRIVGQPLRDANSHIYPCEIPDDEILNCSLQQVERGKNVILLSNDKNLCNKATINNVRHISVSKLRGMLEHRDQGTDPELATTVKYYQQTMYQLLANILENEMRAKYNNLWQHVLFKPPPWSLNDVLECLLKHWIAVFNEVFPRIEHILKDLNCSLTSLEKKDQKTLTHSEVANFKELCVDVSKRCQIIPEYMELAKRTVERLLGGPGRAEPGGDLVRAFEGLWTVLSGYCAKLCSALGLPHNMEDNIPGGEPLPVLVSKWSHINGQLTELTSAIQDVLSVESPVEEHLQRLEGAFNKALSSFCMDGPVSREQLRLFSTKCRNMLEEAHTKFTQLVDLLNVCKNSFSQTN